MMEGVQPQRRAGLSALALGIAIFFLGRLGLGSFLRSWVSEIGAVLACGGLVTFLLTLRGERVSWPHPLVVIVAFLAAALHAYEQLFVMPGRLSAGWLLWGLTPYVLSLAVSAFTGTRTAAIAGAVVALLFDLVLHHDVSTGPKNFAAVLVVMVRPLVSTLIIVPAVIFIAWLLLRRRNRPVGAGP